MIYHIGSLEDENISKEINKNIFRSIVESTAMATDWKME